jgi:hypothetical protein
MTVPGATGSVFGQNKRHEETRILHTQIETAEKCPIWLDCGRTFSLSYIEMPNAAAVRLKKNPDRTAIQG